MKFKQYIGIILGAFYGLGVRFLLNPRENSAGEIYDYYNIYTISFIWILPIVISIFPLLFAKNEILESKWKQFVFPFLSVLLFFILTLSSGIEDWLCILIIAFPFLLTAGIVGLILGPIIKNRNSNKLYSIVLLPFILSPIETLIPNKTEHFSLNSICCVFWFACGVHQSVTGGGYEEEAVYDSIELRFLNIDNIHKVNEHGTFIHCKIQRCDFE